MAIRNNHFSSIDTKKSTFNLSHKRYTSINFGSIRPNYVKMCLPDEHLYVRPQVSYELKPTTDKVVGTISLNNRSYYVPFRSIWHGFENFLAENKDLHYKTSQNPASVELDSTSAANLPYFTRLDIWGNALRCLASDNTARMPQLNYDGSGVPNFVNDDDIFSEVVGFGYNATSFSDIKPVTLFGNRCAQSYEESGDRWNNGQSTTGTYGYSQSYLNPLLERFSKYGAYNTNGRPVALGLCLGTTSAGAIRTTESEFCSSYYSFSPLGLKFPIEPFMVARGSSTMMSALTGQNSYIPLTTDTEDVSSEQDWNSHSTGVKVVTYWSNSSSALDYYNHFCKPVTETTDADYLAFTCVNVNYQFGFWLVTGINTATYPLLKDGIPYGCPTTLSCFTDGYSKIIPESFNTSSVRSRMACCVFYSSNINGYVTSTYGYTNSSTHLPDDVAAYPLTIPLCTNGAHIVTSDDCYFLRQGSGSSYTFTTNNDFTPLLINVLLLGLLDDPDLFGRGSLMENMGVPMFKDIYAIDYLENMKSSFLNSISYIDGATDIWGVNDSLNNYGYNRFLSQVDLPKTRYIRVPCYDCKPRVVKNSTALRWYANDETYFPINCTNFSALPFIAYGKVVKEHYLPNWDLFRDQVDRIDSPYFNSMSLVDCLKYNLGGNVFYNTFYYGSYNEIVGQQAYLVRGVPCRPLTTQSKSALWHTIEHLPNGNNLLLNFVSHAPLTYDYFSKGWKHENGNLGDKTLLEVQSTLSGYSLSASSIGDTIGKLTNKTKKLLSKAFSFASFGGEQFVFEDFLNHHFDTHLTELGIDDVYLGGFSFPLQLEDVLNTGTEDMLGQKATIGSGSQRPSGVDFYSPEFGIYLSLGTLSTTDLVDCPNNPVLVNLAYQNKESFLESYSPLYQNLGDEEFKNRLDVFQDRGASRQGSVLGYNLRNIDLKTEVNKYMGEFSGEFRNQLIFRRLPIGHEKSITMSYLQPSKDEFIIPFADKANDNILLVFDFNIKSNSYLSNDNIMGFE